MKTKNLILGVLIGVMVTVSGSMYSKKTANLDYLLKRSNTFSGTMPSFTNCPELTIFNCQTNSFSGALPSFAVRVRSVNYPL